MTTTSPLPPDAAGEPAGRLQVIGIGAVEELLYRALLGAPYATVSALAASSGITVSRARRALVALERAGFVSYRPDSPGRFVPAPPDVAVGALISSRHQDLEHARLHAERLLADFHRGARYRQATEVVEIITRPEVIVRRSAQLMRGAQEEVLLLDKPPYLGATDRADELDGLARGVRWRVVYSPEALDMPGQLGRLARLRRAGEQARVADQVPIKLTIADGRLALLPLVVDESSTDQAAVLVHARSLLATLTTLFDLLWRQGLPLDYAPSREEGAVDRPPDVPVGGHGRGDAVAGSDSAGTDLLPLLAAGMKDEAIARQVGVSLRTVRRWISLLMVEHRVSTRFQLGVAVARHIDRP